MGSLLFNLPAAPPPLPCSVEILEESRRIAQPAKELTDEADRWAAAAAAVSTQSYWERFL